MEYPKEKCPTYARRTMYSIWDVLKNVGAPTDWNRRADYDGAEMRMGSTRYQVFKRGLVCVSCGLQATHFWQEASPIRNADLGVWHFNLYGIDKHNNEILFTKDHIFPRALGGTDDLDNLQTMCAPCNTAKGHSYENPEQRN